MTITDEMVERAAKALYRDWRGDDCKGTPDWRDMCWQAKEGWRRKARGALEAALSRLTAPLPEEIAGLLADADKLSLCDPECKGRCSICPQEFMQKLAAALRAQAQENERLKHELQAKRPASV